MKIEYEKITSPAAVIEGLAYGALNDDIEYLKEIDKFGKLPHEKFKKKLQTLKVDQPSFYKPDWREGIAFNRSKLNSSEISSRCTSVQYQAHLSKIYFYYLTPFVLGTMRSSVKSAEFTIQCTNERSCRQTPACWLTEITLAQ